MAESAAEAELIARAAGYFSRRAEFLGYWLETYREGTGTEAHVLARHLGCSVETLHHLALCFAPRAEQFGADTAELAARYGIDQDRLADLLHDAETMRTAGNAFTPDPTVQFPQPFPPGVFAAARDLDAEPATPEVRDGDEAPAEDPDHA